MKSFLLNTVIASNSAHGFKTMVFSGMSHSETSKGRNKILYDDTIKYISCEVFWVFIKCFYHTEMVIQNTFDVY